MRAAIIDGGVVTNIAVATPEFAQEQGWVVSDTAQVGDLWDGVSFSKPSVTEVEIEAQWVLIRADRNFLLARSDWTQLDDTPLTNTAKQEWASYRQALRDITLQTDPFNIVWPEAPAA